MGIRMFLYGQIKGIEYQFIVIAVAHDKGHYFSGMKIEDGTEVQFLSIVSVLHFCYVGEPFFVASLCCEFSVQDIFGSNLRSRCNIAFSLSADHRTQSGDMIDSIETFSAVVRVVPAVKLVADAAVAINTVKFSVKLRNRFQKLYVLLFLFAYGTLEPFIVTRAVQVQNIAYFLN